MRNRFQHPGTDGFSLVEIGLALGIAAFALFAIFGLLPVGIASNQSSVRQTEALNLATAVVEDLRQAEAGPAAISPRYGISFDPTQASQEFLMDTEGNRVASPQAAFYRVRIALTAPAHGERRATCGTVTLGWPAEAVAPSSTVAAFVAFDRH